MQRKTGELKEKYFANFCYIFLDDINLVHSITQRHLSLRKQKIDSIFLQRRLAALKESSESTESGETDSIQFTEKDLNIPPEDYLEINSIVCFSFFSLI